MCGITGIIGGRATKEQLSKAIRALRHRGPDSNGYFINETEDVGLAHTRLSIIDLSTGAQPLYSQDKNIVLVINGEIYDFERIREDLKGKGHKFSTKCDSEVVINLYLEHGLDGMFEHLRGEFAFLLYDRSTNIVIAARDRFGIKPLYVSRNAGHFVFSSEAKGIFATGILKPEIDPLAIRNLLSFAPIDSIFKGITSLDPGCYLKIDLNTNGSELCRYWDLDLPTEAEIKSQASFEDYVMIIQKEIDTAVSLRLRADVPVGVYLSGGIDSAAVAGTISMQNHDKLHAFTISFTDEEQYNELSLAKKMAASINAELHVASCSNDTLLENLVDCLWYSEIPTVNLHGVGKFMLSKLARKHVVVVLTGEGADETFLGYKYFTDPNRPFGAVFDQVTTVREKDQDSPFAKKIVDELGFIPQNEMIRSMSPNGQRLFKFILSIKHQLALKQNQPIDFVKTRINRQQTDGRSWIRKIQYFSIRGMMAPYILSILGDRQEMAHSIEGRTPLLDHHLFETARHIPDQLKVNDGIEKYIFREAMKGRVIPEIYNSRKWPYSAPPVSLYSSKSQIVAALLDKHLSKESIDEAGIFKYSSLALIRIIARLWPFNTSLKKRMNMLLLFVLSVQIVYDLYVRNFDEMIYHYEDIGSKE